MKAIKRRSGGLVQNGARQLPICRNPPLFGQDGSMVGTYRSMVVPCPGQGTAPATNGTPDQLKHRLVGRGALSPTHRPGNKDRRFLRRTEIGRCRRRFGCRSLDDDVVGGTLAPAQDGRRMTSDVAAQASPQHSGPTLSNAWTRTLFLTPRFHVICLV